MTPAIINPPRVRGACPGALVPMEVADGLLVRLRIPGGRLTGPMTAAICDLAERHGNGLVDLSQRANLQLRGVRPETLSPLTDALRALGLVNGDPTAERVRNVLCSPTCGLDPACAPVRPLAVALDTALSNSPDLWTALPAKFSFVLNGGGQAPLADAVGDIRFDALPDTALFRVAVGGDQASATPLGVCAADVVVDTALALSRAYLRLSASRYRRLAALVAAEGAAGLAAHLSLAPLSVDASLPSLHLNQVLGAQAGWVGLAFPFGGLSVQRLAQIAHMTPVLRLTPWRALLLEGNFSGDPVDIFQPLGFILAPDDPRLALSACSGRGACDSGLTDARRDALALAQVAPRLLARGHIHVSACTKGCAHPAPALVTLTARDSQAGNPVYDIGLLAAAGGTAQWRGVTPARATSLVAALEAVYTDRRRQDEDPTAFVTRLGGPAELAAQVEAHAA
ncbi:precorrin-3B synthase [Nitrospirillum pindoramense]|uniref:Precorrin-3B synthase n=1 Tax=Nitrospirillum amazonense TaxID=28077 RepID=A0A560H4I4_9PROT|nr:precorrin-3B synthase [Nitrospirillum amazonense]TWB41183.1 precorrin-3B synthase [Nitrospirillum amazonense]